MPCNNNILLSSGKTQLRADTTPEYSLVPVTHRVGVGNSITAGCQTRSTGQVRELANSKHIRVSVELALPSKSSDDSHFGTNTGEAEESQYTIPFFPEEIYYGSPPDEG